MSKLHQLIADVDIVRNNYCSIIRDLTQEKVVYIQIDNVWNILDITEHLFWAEQGGVFGIPYRQAYQSSKKGFIINMKCICSN